MPRKESADGSCPAWLDCRRKKREREVNKLFLGSFKMFLFIIFF